MSDADSKPKSSRRINIAIAVFAVMSIAAGVYLRCDTSGGDRSSAEVEWQCLPNPDRTVTCVFRVTEGAGSICFDMVLACDDGEHRADVCSGVITPGGDASVQVTNIEPPIGPTIRCDKPSYENKKTKVERKADSSSPP